MVVCINCQRLFVFMFAYAYFANGSKKGLAVNSRNFRCDDLDAFDNIGWWYDRHANFGFIVDTSGCLNLFQHADMYVPMTRNYGSYFSEYSIYTESQYLLTFNKPNNFDHSGLTPEEAARHWPEVEALAAGRPIISPSAAPCEYNCLSSTKEWFDWFFGNCSGCRVDYLATHAFFCDSVKTMAFLEDLYRRYNLKIWLTEFACNRTTDVNGQLNLMAELLTSLEETDFVYRYAWYAHRIQNTSLDGLVTWTASLLEPDTSTLTQIGQMYNNFTYQTTSLGTSATTKFSTLPILQGVCRRRIRK